ncbi:tetratricopeptide repeat protein [Vibrio sp. CAU 1672]|uniref:tetratricopeptide repeat protein n=1 Tax=Vibrio sp. CAU 1672 TaxID=3032594 RepID=UPI0023DC8E21|nr:tetratricopeptide repeat protein [Vibrio sp. CAU 1672]MDF2155625.1 tetratricopeptide repeat protein [Vibrio sp. CAU 1672]
MSAINKALTELAEQQSSSPLEKVDVTAIASPKPWLWLVAGFSLSLAVGGWAVSQAPEAHQGHPLAEVVTTGSSQASLAEPSVVSPTSKVTPELTRVVQTRRIEAPFKDTARSVSATHSQPAPDLPGADITRQEPLLLVQATSVQPAPAMSLEPAAAEEVQAVPVMSIEQVELTPQQLAQAALGRAEKAMDANDMQSALSAFYEVLRYEPGHVVARQKLAALYFGKGDTRKAYELLQAGIKSDPDNQTLRLALAQMLVKAGQPQAALSPLVYLPANPERDYIAMRAALAQKQKHNDIALESYQLLTEQEPENARWWLGLAIQQERALAFEDAIQAYQNALGKIGISNQSQAFIRDRLALLEQLEKAQ